MIVDASALIAIVSDEEAGDRCADAVLGADAPIISAANALEAAIVVDGRGDPTISREFDRVRAELGIAIAPVTATHVEIARQAYRDYGRGSGHPAQLNFGDCFAYALAAELDRPLLFIGNDFDHTDVEPALS